MAKVGEVSDGSVSGSGRSMDVVPLVVSKEEMKKIRCVPAVIKCVTVL